jgi:hypothetical protein
MKRVVIILSLSIVAILIFIGKNPSILDKSYIFWNNLAYPSPITWNNMKIYYAGNNTIFRKNENGPLFITWRNSPNGFLGFSSIPKNETTQNRIECIKNSALYSYVSDWPDTIDNKYVHNIHAINKQSNEKVVFIMIPITNTLVMFQGTEEGYTYFMPIINSIKFFNIG